MPGRPMPRWPARRSSAAARRPRCSGSRTVTSAQAGSFASSAGSSDTVEAQPASSAPAAERRTRRRERRSGGARFQATRGVRLDARAMRPAPIAWRGDQRRPTTRPWGSCRRARSCAASSRGSARRDALVGPGDDAAVLAAPDGRVVATTDTLVHGPDFRLAWSSGFDLGWKAAAVNLADIAAMGARPTALLVALAMPNDTRLSFVEQLADGLRAACDALAPGCAVEGGDLTVSDTLTIAVTALGSLDGRAPVLRCGARAGRRRGGRRRARCRRRAGSRSCSSRFRDAAGEPVPVDRGVLVELPTSDVSASTRSCARSRPSRSAPSRRMPEPPR